MSNVWETRYRLLLEQLEELADQLSGEEPIEPAVLTGQTVRLLAGVVTLLRQHRVNKRGQCKYCRSTRWTRRLWHRRPQCTVYRGIDFALTQSLDVAWWQLLESHTTRPSSE